MGEYEAHVVADHPRFDRLDQISFNEAIIMPTMPALSADVDDALHDELE